MEATRAAIRRGRRRYAAGRLEDAVGVWRAALAEAYATRDYAGMFVLTRNLGEASAALAERTAEHRTKWLPEAVAYFQYALELVDKCGLRQADQVDGRYSVLFDTVRRVETQRADAEARIQTLETPVEQEAATEREETCATCGRTSTLPELVLDGNDGRYYCRSCYDEYYARMRAETEDVEEFADAQMEESSPTTSSVVTPSDFYLSIDLQGEEGAPDNEEVDEQQEDNADLHPQLDEPSAAELHDTVDEQWSTDDVPQIRYSIQELIDLREQSPTECPDELARFPIGKPRASLSEMSSHDSPSSSHTPSDSEPSPGRSQSDAAPPPAPTSVVAKDTTPTISLSALPSLGIVEAMRSARKQQADLSPVEAAAEMEALALELFDIRSPETLLTTSSPEQVRSP